MPEFSSPTAVIILMGFCEVRSPVRVFQHPDAFITEPASHGTDLLPMHLFAWVLNLTHAVTCVGDLPMHISEWVKS